MGVEDKEISEKPKQKLLDFFKGRTAKTLEGKEQINYEILKKIFDEIFYTTFLKFKKKKEIKELRNNFLRDNFDEEKLYFNKKEINEKISSFFEKELNEQLRTSINNDDLVEIGENFTDGINNFKEDNKSKIKNLTKINVKKIDNFQGNFLKLYSSLEKIAFLFSNFPDLEIDRENQISGKFIFKILNIITPNSNPALLVKHKKFSILISLLQEEDKELNHKEFKKVLAEINAYNLEFNTKGIIKEILEDIFGDSIKENKLEKFINSQIIKELYKIEKINLRKKITKIIFLKDNFFMGEEEIQHKKLFEFLIKNEDKLDNIYKFFTNNSNNDIKNISEEKLIEMFENNIYEIEKNEQKFNGEIKINNNVEGENGGGKKEGKRKTRGGKSNEKVNGKEKEQEKEQEKIIFSNDLDIFLEEILKENNLEKIEEIGKEIEIFLQKLVGELNPKKFSSTNDNRNSGGGNFFDKSKVFFNKIKKQPNEDYIDFLKRIQIIDFSSFFKNTEFRYKKGANIKKSFEKNGKIGFFEALEKFGEKIIGNIQLNEKEEKSGALKGVIKKYNEILKRELNILERKIKNL